MGYSDWFSVVVIFIFVLSLYVLKHLIRYKMVSNLIHFILLIQHTAINICFIKKQRLQEHSNLLYQLVGLVFSDCFWFSVDAIHFIRSKSV